MLSIAVLNKILDNCLYMGYKPTSNSEPQESSRGKSLNNFKESQIGKIPYIIIYIITLLINDWLINNFDHYFLSSRSSESDEEYSPLGDYSGPTNLGHCAHNQVFGFFSSITLRGLIKEVR